VVNAPAAFPPGQTRYPCPRRLGGPQGRSGLARNISPPPGFDPRTVQPLITTVSATTALQSQSSSTWFYAPPTHHVMVAATYKNAANNFSGPFPSDFRRTRLSKNTRLCNFRDVRPDSLSRGQELLENNLSMLYSGVLVLWSTSSKWHCTPRSYFTVYCLLFCGSTSHHPQLADGKFLISGYGLISLEAQRLIPFLSLGDKSLLQNATRNTFLSLNLFHCIRLLHAN
jgi:hypothetical protein